MSNNNDMFGNFGELFGLAPVEKKKETKKKVPKTEKKPAKSTKSSSKKEVKKYDVPVQVHTEWGVVEVSGGGKPLSLTEIGDSLPIPQTVSENDGVFVATFKDNISLVKKNEKISGQIFENGEFKNIEPDVTAGDILKEYSDKKEVFKIKDGIYAVRYPKSAASNWNLKVSGGCYVGFVGNYKNVCKDAGEITLKEAVLEFIKECKWINNVEYFYVFAKDKGRDIVTLQLSTAKVESKEITVKLPCNIKFIHDAGPLSEGLTPEMFDGKEYVNEKDIMKLVDKYFPNIYKSNNTSITYVDTINTVCLLRVSREKGTGSLVDTSVGVFEFSDDSDSLNFCFKLPKIPIIILKGIDEYFRLEAPTEAIAQIVFEPGARQYRAIIPNADKTLARVSWSDAEVLSLLEGDEFVVMEIHSHNTMNAFFSSIDNRDEVLPLLYGVIGHVDHEHSEIKIRAGASGKFKNLRLNQIFDIPNLVKNNNTYYVRLAENANDGIYMNLISGEFVIGNSIKYAPDGNLTWEYGKYYGQNFLKIDWMRILEVYSKKVTDKVIISELLERTVELRTDEDIDDVRDSYRNEKIVLDEADFKDVYFRYANS